MPAQQWCQGEGARDDLMPLPSWVWAPGLPCLKSDLSSLGLESHAFPVLATAGRTKGVGHLSMLYGPLGAQHGHCPWCQELDLP